MTICLQWERSSDIFEEFQGLFDAHYYEIYKKVIQVNPSMFAALEASGALFLLTAREEGVPVGYYGSCVSPSIYKADILEARDVGIYVIPDKRNLGITTEMQRVMDEHLKEIGVKTVIVSYPTESSIPVEQEYKLKEMIYERIL